MSDKKGGTDPFYVTLGSVLQELRLKRGLTLDRLGQVITRTNLSKIETGQVQPGLPILLKLCEAYGVAISLLLITVEARLAGLPIENRISHVLDEVVKLARAGNLDTGSIVGSSSAIKQQRTDELRRRVRSMAAAGQANADIAQELGVSLRSVQRHLKG